MNNRIDAIYARQSVDKKDSISIESQIEFCKYELKGGNCKEYTDKGYSGKNTDRPKLTEMMDFAREGDEIYIHDFSRLARSTKDLLNIIERLDAKGVKLISNKENLDTHTPTGKLMLTMIGAISEFERATILERQREGIIIAKREGRMSGRKQKVILEGDWKEALSMYNSRQINKRQFAERLHISRPTLDKLLRKEGEKSDNQH